MVGVFQNSLPVIRLSCFMLIACGVSAILAVSLACLHSQFENDLSFFLLSICRPSNAGTLRWQRFIVRSFQGRVFLFNTQSCSLLSSSLVDCSLTTVSSLVLRGLELIYLLALICLSALFQAWCMLNIRRSVGNPSLQSSRRRRSGIGRSRPHFLTNCETTKHSQIALVLSVKRSKGFGGFCAVLPFTLSENFLRTDQCFWMFEGRA